MPNILTDFNNLVDFIDLANELGGQVIIEGDSLPPEMIAEAIASANQTEEVATS